MWVWARLFVGVLALVFVSKWWSRVEGVGVGKSVWRVNDCARYMMFRDDV